MAVDYQVELRVEREKRFFIHAIYWVVLTETGGSFRAQPASQPRLELIRN